MKNFYKFIIFIFCFVFSISLYACDVESMKSQFDKDDYLVGPFSVKQFENGNTNIIGVNNKPIKVDKTKTSWINIVQKYKVGDCLMYYRSKSASWNQLMGREAVVLFRDNKPIEVYFLAIS